MNLAQLIQPLVTEHEDLIDELLPKDVKRVGPIELNLSFTDGKPEWYGAFHYKVQRRGNSQRLSGREPHEDPQDALRELAHQVSLANRIPDGY